MLVKGPSSRCSVPTVCEYIGGCRFMLELTTEQCSEYVNKIVTLADSAGCQVTVLLTYLAIAFSALTLLVGRQEGRPVKN